MYKKFDFETLCSIDTKLTSNIKKLYSKKWYQFFKEFIKNIFKESREIHFWESNSVIFSFIKEDEKKICITDEKEKIELILEGEDIQKMHNLLKNEKKLKDMQKNNKSIMDSVLDDYKEWNLNYIDQKPFLVYDVETIWDINNFDSLQFKIWYATISNEKHSPSIAYKYVSEENLKRFVDFLLDFDGYIIWYNHIFFDNPVVCKNIWYTDNEIEMLNSKSLDIFLFLWNITGKRMWLDKVSKSLISIWKTLSSGQEWEEIITKYEETGDEKLLKKAKNYCRNDVKMTLWVLLYILKYQQLYIDGSEINYEITEFIKYSQNKIQKKQVQQDIKSQPSIL